MKTFHNYKIVKENYKSQSEAGRYNPALVIRGQWKRKSFLFVIGAGYNDSVYVFIESDILYVLSINCSLDYVGLERFYLIDKEGGMDVLGDSIFCQGSEQYEEILGKGGLAKYTTIHIAKILAGYLCEVTQ